MAFQLNFTDEYGQNYPESYWHVVQVNLCKAESNGRIILHGFADAASTGKRVIGEHAYDISGETFLAYFSPTAIDPLSVNHLSQAYALALATLDTPSGNLDESGQPINVSFFANATNV